MFWGFIDNIRDLYYVADAKNKKSISKQITKRFDKYLIQNKTILENLQHKRFRYHKSTSMSDSAHIHKRSITDSLNLGAHSISTVAQKS
mmetsp:Transcript_15104/g.22831  ORF Transcript_15104/g.22831 Transcript_15104/m.22831 type:complete len:89 (-) Transcript_15104:563-829(-)